MDSNDSSGGLVVLAVDDEEPALEELAYLLKEDPRVGVVLKASDATDALRILNSRQGVREAATAGQAVGGRALNPMTGMRVAERSDIEVVFLDIRMPGLDGLELARVFSLDGRAAVGRVRHRARRPGRRRLRGRRRRLPPQAAALRAARRVARPDHRQPRRGAPPSRCATTPTRTRSSPSSWRAPRSSCRARPCATSRRRATTPACTPHEGSHLVRIPLSVLEDRWREAGFVRIHRSFLVSLPLVTELRLSGSGLRRAHRQRAGLRRAAGEPPPHPRAEGPPRAGDEAGVEPALTTASRRTERASGP